MSDDDRFDGEGKDPPGGGLTAPWEDDPGTEEDSTGGESIGDGTAEADDGPDGRGAVAAAGERGADDTTPRGADTGEGSAAPSGSAPSVGALERIAFLLPRVLALVLLVGLPGAVFYALLVQHFELAPLYRVIGLLGIAFLARWALKPHVGTFLTPPAERE